jgi:hypothetical protein
MTFVHRLAIEDGSPMIHRRSLRLAIAAPVFGSLVAAGSAACDEETNGQPGFDGGVGFETGTATDASAAQPDATPTGPTDAGGDSAVDPKLPITCKTLHAANPSQPSGVYTIDLDGNGTAFPPISVYCDMTFDGGGWTMIQSFTGSDSPGSLGAGGTDAGPGLLIAVPRPGQLGGLTGDYVAALANISSQVHIRLSFASDAGADGGTWVTSRALEDGGSTRVITNLRNLDVLTKDTDGGFEEWTGPQATAEKLSWVPLYGGGPATCLNPVQSTKYPSIYWACGNFSSMNLYAPQALCRWTYTPSTGNEPLEVLVR